MRTGFFLVCLLVWRVVVMADITPAASVTVHRQVVNRVDERLFGQFMERPSGEERGPEAFADATTGELPEPMVAMLKRMRIPVIRFPAGTDIDYIDWRDMIDHVPGREAAGRPMTKGRDGHEVTNRFGYDEYFALRDVLGCQTIVVVNLLDGLARRKPLDEAAAHAAGLVAYVNAEQGAQLPAGMTDWPAVRAMNGHAAPFGAQYVQIGNEMFLGEAQAEVRKATGLEGEALARWYLQAYSAYVKAIRQVDAKVQIIIDAHMAAGAAEVVLADPYIKANVAYVTRHTYAPGSADDVKRNGERVDPASITSDQWWWIWATMPGDYDAMGQCQGLGDSTDAYRQTGYQVAVTEWNWNGWRWHKLGTDFDAPAAAGIGAAGFIHGLMRHGDAVVMANQSMLVGNGWGIAAIMGDPTGKTPAYFNPQGSATTFYNLHHGEARLACELRNVPTRPQPIKCGWGSAHESAAVLDVIVTMSDDKVFVHAINRSFDQDLPLEIDMRELGAIGEAGVHHLFTCKLRAEPGHGSSNGMARISQEPFKAADQVTVMLPRRSASILEFPRTGR